MLPPTGPFKRSESCRRTDSPINLLSLLCILWTSASVKVLSRGCSFTRIPTLLFPSPIFSPVKTSKTTASSISGDASRTMRENVAHRNARPGRRTPGRGTPEEISAAACTAPAAAARRSPSAGGSPRRKRGPGCRIPRAAPCGSRRTSRCISPSAQDVGRLPFLEERTVARGDDVDRGPAPRCSSSRFHDPLDVEEVHGSVTAGPVARKPLPAEDHAEPGLLEMPLDERLSRTISRPRRAGRRRRSGARCPPRSDRSPVSRLGRIKVVSSEIGFFDADRVGRVEPEEAAQPLPVPPRDEGEVHRLVEPVRPRGNRTPFP